jgi:hypothetical protein
VSKSCRFYYEDSYRKSPKKECRLIRLNPDSEPWRERLCRKCPVPEILERNPCTNLALEAEAGSRWGLLSRLTVFAVCTVKMEKLADPMTCTKGCDRYDGLV